MKNLAIGLLVVGLLLFSLSACDSGKEGNSGSNEGSGSNDILGLWFDVSSPAEIEVKENELSLTIAGITESEAYRMKSEDGKTYLTSEEEGGNFGLITKIEVREDGSLRTYQNAFDVERYEYRFVRKEALEKEREIQDLSEDLAKVIESTKLNRFELQFYNSGSYGISEDWPQGNYEWVIEQEANGGFIMSFNIMGSSTIVMRYREKVDAEFVDGLAALIQEQKLPLLNGYHKKNNANTPGYSLLAMYESGETLIIGAEGDAAASCAFDIQPLLDYAAKLDLGPIY